MGFTATVTFLFVDLVGSTELLHRIGDDANDELTRRYQALMREAVERHGGEVLRTMGDGLTVVFEHSAAAALAAAIDMQRAIDRMGRADPLLRLQIRVGVSMGEAARMEGDWSGTPIFEAARLESKAWPGTILVNDVIRVLLGNRGGFEFTPVGALELKGFPEPLPAAEVAWEPDPGRPEVPLASALEVGLDWPLVGRDAELARLCEAWAAGRPKLVTVTGEGGVGKTRLAAGLAVVVQQGDGVPVGTVLYGRCGDDPGPPLGPFAEALRWWAASVTPEVLRGAVADDAALLVGLVPSLAARLPELVGGAAAVDADRLAEAVARVVGRATEATGAWLVIIDAAQVADEMTAAMVEQLTDGDQAVMVLAAGRDPGRFGGAGRVELAGLDGDATAALLDEVAARAGVAEVPAEMAARTQVETGGNPRLVIEAGERLIASGALGLAEGAGRDEVVRRAITGVSPYKGLLAYQADDAEDFFGRDSDIAALLGRVAATRLLAVVGASGSGKSSLVRAGLLPALRRGALAGSGDWPQVLFNAGPRPLLELAAGVAATVDRSVAEVLTALESGPAGLDTILRDTPGAPARVVVVVDQFEEIFTACDDDTERGRFVDALLHAATVPDGRALVVVVLRADFFGHCAELPGLAAALESTTVLLGPMDEPALRAVIEGPARRADLSVEPGLVDAMVGDVSGEPGGLPLLSHALYETWERRENRTLTRAGYRDAGGARGAIARTADTVFTTQLDADGQRLARRLFLDLTELGEGTEDTRRRAVRADLDERAGGAGVLDPVLEVLVGSRLVTVGDDTVEVAHEALIREWPRLRDWLDEDRETLRALRHLGVAAGEWDQGGREPADLYRGPRLAAALDASDVDDRQTVPLTGTETAFLTASRDAEEAETRRHRTQNRRLRRLLAGVLALAVAAGIAGLSATRNADTARRNEVIAEERAAEALSQSLASGAQAEALSNPELALLLGVEAARRDPTLESHGGLLHALAAASGSQGFRSALPIEGRERIVGGDAEGDAVIVADSESGTVHEISVGSGDRDELLSVSSSFDRTEVWPTSSGPVALQSTQAAVEVFDLATGEQVGRRLETTTREAAISPDRRLVAISADNDSFRLWDLELGSASGPTITAADSLIREMMFTADGSGLVLRTEDVVVRYDVGSGRQIWRSRLDQVFDTPTTVSALDLLDDGRIICGDSGGHLFLVDGTSGSIALAQDVGVGAIDNLVVVPGDSRAVLGDREGGVYEVVLPAQGATSFDPPLRVGSHTGRFRVLDADASGDVITAGAEAVARWSLSSSSAGVLGRWFGAQIDGGVTVVGNVEPGVVLVDGFSADHYLMGKVDIRNGRRVAQVDLPYDAVGSSAALPGGRVAVAWFDGVDPYTEGDAGIWLVDLDTGEIETSYPLGEWAYRLAATSDGSRVVAVGEFGMVALLDVDAGTVSTAEADLSTAVAVDWAPDGMSFAVGDAGGDVVVFDSAGREQWSIGLGRGSVNAIEYASSGDSLAAATGDGAVVVVDTASQEITSITPTGAGELLAIAHLGDPELLAAGSREGSVLLIDPSRQRMIGPPLTGTGAIWGIFADEQGRLVYGTSDGVSVRSVALDSLVEAACDLAGRNLTSVEWGRYLPGTEYRPTCAEWPARPDLPAFELNAFL